MKKKWFQRAWLNPIFTHINVCYCAMKYTNRLLKWYNWSNITSGSGEERENVKSLRRRQRRRQRLQTKGKLWSEKLTWDFGPGELKSTCTDLIQLTYDDNLASFVSGTRLLLKWNKATFTKLQYEKDWNNLTPNCLWIPFFYIISLLAYLLAKIR